MIGVLLLAIAAPIGLHLEELEEIPIGEALELADQFGAALRTRTATAVVIDDPAWSSSCSAADRCLSEIRARTGAERIVMLRIYRGPTKTHLIAELVAGSSAEVDLPHGVPWKAQLDQLASLLFPGTARVALPAAVPLPEEPPRAEVIPWILAGSAAVAAGFGIGFGVSARRANDRIEADVLNAPEYESLSGRVDQHSLGANISFAAAVATGIAAIILFAAD